MGYHPSDHSYPRDENQVFEICVGAILTQNTTWLQVEKSLGELKKAGCLDPEKMARIPDTRLKTIIKPTGYYNQKSKKIRQFNSYFLNRKGPIPPREDLLNIWGIGPETADSILLYAFKQPYFVVDAYTYRWIERFIAFTDTRYHSVQSAIQETFFFQSPQKKVETYNEFHALLVRHSKETCKKKPCCSHCPLKDTCFYYIKHGESHG